MKPPQGRPRALGRQHRLRPVPTLDRGDAERRRGLIFLCISDKGSHEHDQITQPPSPYSSATANHNRESYAVGAGRQRAGRARPRGRPVLGRVRSTSKASRSPRSRTRRISRASPSSPRARPRSSNRSGISSSGWCRSIPSPISRSPRAPIERELAMVKVRGKGDERVEAMQLAEAFRAKVIDATSESFIFEITGAPSKIDDFVADAPDRPRRSVAHRCRRHLARARADLTAQRARRCARSSLCRKLGPDGHRRVRG